MKKKINNLVCQGANCIAKWGCDNFDYKTFFTPDISQKNKDIEDTYENWRKFVDPNRKWMPTNPNSPYVIGDYPPYYVVDYTIQTNVNK